MLRAAHEETRACDMHSLTSEPTHSRHTVEALWPALHPIHEVDAVLAGGRATPTTNSCTGNRDKAPRRKCSQFLEQLGSVAVAVPADYTRYMNQLFIDMGKVGETVKYRALWVKIAKAELQATGCAAGGSSYCTRRSAR